MPTPQEAGGDEAAEQATVRLLVGLMRALSLASHAHSLSKSQGSEFLIAFDVLRACVVTTHASFEDFLRTIAQDRLRRLDSGCLAGVKFPGDQRPEKIAVADLGKYRLHTVEQLIGQCVDEHVSRLTLNNARDVDALLKRLRIDPAPLVIHYPNIDWMIARRHKIVHEADLQHLDNGEFQVRDFDANDFDQLGTMFKVIRAFCGGVVQAVAPQLWATPTNTIQGWTGILESRMLEFGIARESGWARPLT